MKNLFKVTINILNFIDHIQSKKIFKFLSKNLNEDSIIFDVGSHKGETIFLINKFIKAKKVFSFEISKKNYKAMIRKISNKKFNFILHCNNFGLSDKSQKKVFSQAIETSSTTLSPINENSKYFKKKMRALGFNKNENFFQKEHCYVDTLDNFLKNNNIERIDLLKIDTEGHEYEVLRGGSKNLKDIKYIYFEHHYDDMIVKNYTF
jgi:FkbM family methyltransferase